MVVRLMFVLCRPCHGETDDAEFNLIDLADLHVLDFGEYHLSYVVVHYSTSALILKFTYLCRGSTDFDEIWHTDALRPS